MWEKYEESRTKVGRKEDERWKKGGRKEEKRGTA